MGTRRSFRREWGGGSPKNPSYGEKNSKQGLHMVKNIAIRHSHEEKVEKGPAKGPA